MARKFKRSQAPRKKLALSWPELKSEVARLSSVGNYAGALELLETRPPGEEGQQLWKETYQRRLEHLLDRGKAGEAARGAAEGLKLEPNWQPLEFLLTRARAVQGDWDGVFQELLGDRRLFAEEAIRRELVDLNLLARCSLESHHPLRQSATELSRCFDSVTCQSGEPLVLPDLSRRNPLAGWRLLIQAIEAFYRYQDELCGRLLASIADDSAAARGGKVLRAALDGRQSPPLAAELLERQALHETLEKLDGALQKKGAPGQFMTLLNDVRAQLNDPGLWKLFQQRLWIRLEKAAPSALQLFSRLGTPPADADFWRELALDVQHEIPLRGAVAWEEFRYHTRAAGQLEPACESALLLHVLGLLSEARDQRTLPQQIALVKRIYQSQPAEICKPSPLAGGKPPADYLNAQRLYHRACALDPIAENFQAWLKWEKTGRDGDPKSAAEAWLAHHPQDVEALKALIEIHERTAPAKAQTYLARALTLDKLDPQLQRTQPRLALTQALKSLALKKAAPPGPAFYESLAGSPQAGLLTPALRCLEAVRFGEREKARDCFAELARELGGPSLAFLLLDCLNPRGKINIGWLSPSSTLKAAALPGLAKLAACRDEFRLDLFLPDVWERTLVELLPKAAKPLSTSMLADLARFANQVDFWEWAYRLTQSGLERPEKNWLPAFLLERGRSIPESFPERFRDCVAASWSLARQLGDEAQMSQAVRLAGEWGVDPKELTLAPPELERILQMEKMLVDYPEDLEDEEDFEFCDCPECRAKLQAFLENPGALMDFLEQMAPEKRRR